MTESRKISVGSNNRIQRLWNLFGVAWAFAPIGFGWLSANQIECASCLREVLVHSLALFGYVVLGGFVYSFSRPALSKQPPGYEVAATNGYMLGTREDVVSTSILLGAFFAGFSFLAIYQF